MVRLKANKGVVTKDSESISIPYGAIKSPIEAYRRLLSQWISIPYGAIKRPALITL